MYIYLNGEFLLENDAKISPFDHGYLYGLGLFETLRLYDGHPFLLGDHFQRLQVSLAELNIQCELTQEKLSIIIRDLSRLNNLTNAYIRVNISAGPAPIGLQANPYIAPTIIIFMKELPDVKFEEKSATILNIKRNSPEGYIRFKSHNYLNNVIAKREIGRANKEGIFLTENNYVAEGIVSNVFWVKNKEVFTPCIETGILNGITRQFIISMLRKEKINVREGFFKSEELLDADEVFLTNSIQEIVAVSEIDYVRFGEYRTVKRLQQQYKEYVKKGLNSTEQLSEGEDLQ